MSNCTQQTFRFGPVGGQISLGGGQLLLRIIALYTMRPTLLVTFECVIKIQ